MRNVEDAFWLALVIMLFCCLPLLAAPSGAEGAEAGAATASRQA